MPSILSHHAPTLRGIAESLGIVALTQVAREPGITAAIRVSVHYADRRAHDSVATLTRSTTTGCALTVAYRGALEGKPLTYRIAPDRYEGLITAFMRHRFDALRDMPDLPQFDTVELWMIERAAGTFAHSVILTPERTDGAYIGLIAAVRAYLPEAVREVR